MTNISIDIKAENYEMTINHPSINFDITNTYGQTYSIGSTELSLEVGSRSTVSHRSFIEWDISDIPDDANIREIVFMYHGHHSYATLARISACSTYHPSIISTTDYGNLFEDVNTRFYTPTRPDQGTSLGTLVKPEPMSYIYIGNSSTSYGCLDLENMLSNDWFAIAICANDETYATGVQIGVMYNSFARYANPPPSLWVNFHLHKTITWEQPTSIDIHSSSEHISFENMLGFMDSLFKKEEARQLTISGTTHTNAEADLETLYSIYKLGIPVALSNMDDSNLDGDYVITEIDYNRNEGEVDIYHYTLLLDKTYDFRFAHDSTDFWR